MFRSAQSGLNLNRSAFDLNHDDDNTHKKKKKKAIPSKYNYSFGDEYPVGKRKLVVPTGYLVPEYMGWLWNKEDITGRHPKKNWQPGSVGKTIAQMMNFKCRGGAAASDKQKKKKKRKRKTKEGLAQGDGESDDEPLEPRPALKVHRKGDTFTIEVNPLKDLTELLPNEDPYIGCDPLVFKIMKQRSPEEKAKVEARRLMKLKKARDTEIRKALSEAVEDICKCAYMDVYCNDYTAIDNVINKCPVFEEPKCICESESLSSLSSNATWDIEYTPPYGCFDLNPRKRKHLVHVDTQYSCLDFTPPAKKEKTDKKDKYDEKKSSPLRKCCRC